MCQCFDASRVQGESISTAGATRLGYSRSMQHIINSATTAPTVRMRVVPARRARDEANAGGEDALAGFKGIAVGLLLGVAVWMLLLGLYFLI